MTAYVPRLLKVRCDRFGDELTVRMLPGQIPDDWGQAAERLAYAFRLRTGQARSAARPDRVVLRFVRRDPLAGVVAPLPVPEVPDFDGLALGVDEDGHPYRLRLTRHACADRRGDRGGQGLGDVVPDPRPWPAVSGRGWCRCGRSTPRAAWSWRPGCRCSPGSPTTTPTAWPTSSTTRSSVMRRAGSPAARGHPPAHRRRSTSRCSSWSSTSWRR